MGGCFEVTCRNQHGWVLRGDLQQSAWVGASQCFAGISMGGCFAVICRNQHGWVLCGDLQQSAWVGASR